MTVKYQLEYYYSVTMRVTFDAEDRTEADVYPRQRIKERKKANEEKQVWWIFGLFWSAFRVLFSA